MSASSPGTDYLGSQPCEKFAGGYQFQLDRREPRNPSVSKTPRAMPAPKVDRGQRRMQLIMLSQASSAVVATEDATFSAICRVLSQASSAVDIADDATSCALSLMVPIMPVAEPVWPPPMLEPGRPVS
jgi:hypothetical protein